jgi:hypothetical protein
MLFISIFSNKNFLFFDGTVYVVKSRTIKRNSSGV